MFGTVVRGRTSTRFRLEFTLENGSYLEETHIVPNWQLSRYPQSYGFILEDLTSRIERRLNDRHQSMMRLSE